MYLVEADIDLVTGQSFLQKAESLPKIRGRISVRRWYTWFGAEIWTLDLCVCGSAGAGGVI